MDLDELKQILDLVREHDLAEFELEHDGIRLKIRKDATGAAVATTPTLAVALPVAPAGLAAASGSTATAPVAAAGESASPTSEDEAEIELEVVKSPIVGTFYRSPEPGAAAFVEIGSTIKKGQVLCIIEAMKLMNEIDSEYDGQVVSIYVDNGQPVQYGERLFAIRTT
jgi:acetyl-CoA carboxylase biotin carboxyl carrier protein